MTRHQAAIRKAEEPLFREALATHGSISAAARYLGINRATLRTKLERYGISADDPLLPKRAGAWTHNAQAHAKRSPRVERAVGPENP